MAIESHDTHSSSGPQASSEAPELFFGLVAAVGTDLEFVENAVKTALNAAAYQCTTVRISDLLDDLERSTPLRKTPVELRYQDYMDAGDQLRKDTKQKDALAILAVNKVREVRLEATGDQNRPRSRHAYIFRSLKTPEEVETLRSIYGSGFYLVAAYSPEEDRQELLARRIARDRNEKANDSHREISKRIIGRDQKDQQQEFGQNVRGAFPLADLFLDVRSSSAFDSVLERVERFVNLILGYPYSTPTRAESAMFQASAASLRSAELGRQVGAAITTADGDLLVVGANELPVPGGGLHWAEDQPDERDWRRGFDANDKRKRENLAEIIDILRKNSWLSAEKGSASPEELLEDCAPIMAGTRSMNAIEFGRAIHAEMGAITDAARRGIPLAGSTLYTTTFPCHNCARHIIGTGIKRVVYIEPYPKSLALELHQESILLGPPLDEARATSAQKCLAVSEEHRVAFAPFVGVAPRLFMQLFSMPKRKDSLGDTLQFDPTTALPRPSLAPPYLSYFQLESIRAVRLDSQLRQQRSDKSSTQSTE
jgi:deoxycytidylate deaminase